jgi:hypothetical protein
MSSLVEFVLVGGNWRTSDLTANPWRARGTDVKKRWQPPKPRKSQQMRG